MDDTDGKNEPESAQVVVDRVRALSMQEIGQSQLSEQTQKAEQLPQPAQTSQSARIDPLDAPITQLLQSAERLIFSDDSNSNSETVTFNLLDLKRSDEYLNNALSLARKVEDMHTQQTLIEKSLKEYMAELREVPQALQALIRGICKAS